MGIFTRFRDIISSNVNAMLDKAEDPEKLIKMMIQEMEETLVGIKASCAGAMACQKRVKRTLEENKKRASNWHTKAETALARGREDLAREALIEKRNYQQEVGTLEQELTQSTELIGQYQKEIQQLEEKLAATRAKHQGLVQRHIHARKAGETQRRIRKVDTTDAFTRFEQFESRIDRMEADAALVNPPRRQAPIDEFQAWETDAEIEEQLTALKAKSSSEIPS